MTLWAIGSKGFGDRGVVIGFAFPLRGLPLHCLRSGVGAAQLSSAQVNGLSQPWKRTAMLPMIWYWGAILINANLVLCLMP